MSTAVWDPDTILQITDASGRGMFCVGLARPRFDSRCRSRCRWDVPPARYFAILALLGAISTKLPHDVTNSELRRIAQLGLCEYHGDQEDEVVAKWEYVLDRIEDIYQAYEEHRQEIIQDLKVLQKEVNECRSLLGVEDNFNDTLSVVLRRHIDENARLVKLLTQFEAAIEAELQEEQAMVKDKKEENCRLSAENSRLSTLLKRAEEEQERCKDQESNLIAECEKLREQNAELQADINSRKDKSKDLQDREQSATRELMATTTQLHEIQAVNLGLENDKKTLQSEIDILKEEMKRLNHKNTSISSQLASTAASLQTVTDELSVARKENMQLRVQLTTSTTEIMELRSKIDQLSSPVWYKLIQWIKQKFLGLTHLLKASSEVSDKKEGVALTPAVAVRDAGLLDRVGGL